jgi:hemolysin D
VRTVLRPGLAAALDLARRYGAVFRHAWCERKSLDPLPRLPHEAQFLPAALELQESPISPAPRVAMWLIMSFALIAVLWAVFGRMDIVAIARGKIVPNGRSKTIQPFETATVREIRVADGQRVRAGEVLLELDATSADADRARYLNDLVSARAQSARSRAMLTAISSGELSSLEKVAEASTERQIQEQRNFDGQYGEYQAKLTRIDADIARHEAELKSTQLIVRKLEQTVPIARQRAKDFRDLVDKAFISKHGYLEKEQARIEQEGDLATQRSRLTELAAALAEVRGQRAAQVAETRRLALDNLNEGEQKASTFHQELVKAESRGKLMTLRAPVDGTVQQLAVHTVGGVVTPAQALMVIVPSDNPLEVEAFIDNKDIGFVNAGQEAVIKVETFPFTRHGTIPAKVTHVSHDAINDEKKGLIYSMRVHLGRTTMAVEDKVVNLSPGMAVTVEVKTGQRRVIEYFLSPLLQYGNESLHER